MNAPRRILITGGLGFQGYWLMFRWSREGREVTVLNTPSERARKMAARLGGAGLVWGSVHDGEILEKLLPGYDAIVHLAAWASVDVSLDRPWPPFEINAQGTYALLDGLRRFNPTARVLIASSCEVYGPARVSTAFGAERPRPDEGIHTVERALIPQDEDAPMLPRSPYAATKIAADRFAYAFAVTYGLRLTILRPSNVFGPWQRAGAAGAVIPTFVTAALRHEPLGITGGGEQIREFLYIDDLVEAYTLALDAETAPGETFNVGSGDVRSIRQVAEAVTARLPAPIEYRGARVADVSGFRLDSQKFHAAVGWKARVAFDEGLDRYIAWAREHETP